MSFKGQMDYEKVKEGKKVTYKGAVLAKCYECMGFFEDGKQDCLGKSCPLYQYYPYKGK